MRTLVTLLVLPLLLSDGFGNQPTPSSWTLGPFQRARAAAPVIVPNPSSIFFEPIRRRPVHWEALHSFNPAAVVRNGKIYLLYRAEDNTGVMAIGGHTSRLGLAISTDGIHFTRNPSPVFFPANDAQKSREWPGGAEDPRIVEGPNGLYVLTYTQWNRKIFRVGIATSTDLLHWIQHEDARGRPIVALSRRLSRFDSAFPEVGPPPLLTSKGILLIYNGKNDANHGDPSIKPGTYSTGQALFSADDPAKLLARTSKPFLQPEMPYEKTGQYAAGTTFAEGLVFYKGRWFLYYGCADSTVGVVATASTTHR